MIPSVDGVIASSYGRLMVIPKVGVPRQGGKHYGGEPTYGQWDGTRYIYPRRGKTHKVARLVCEAFHGHPFPGAVCMHLDEDAHNNRPENLAWGTQKQNLNAPGFIEYCKGRTGERNPFKKSIPEEP